MQYDYSVTTFSPDGKVFQTEYAQKAVDNSGCASHACTRTGRPAAKHSVSSQRPCADTSKVVTDVCTLFVRALLRAVQRDLLSSSSRAQDHDRLEVQGWRRTGTQRFSHRPMNILPWDAGHLGSRPVLTPSVCAGCGKDHRLKADGGGLRQAHLYCCRTRWHGMASAALLKSLCKHLACSGTTADWRTSSHTTLACW